MNSNTGDSFWSQGVEELRAIKVALQTIAQFAASRSEPSEGRAMTEPECIAWLLEMMQTADRLPSLSEVSRQTGVNRRQLRADRWPRFRKTYDQLAGIQSGLDKSRLVAESEDENE